MSKVISGIGKFILIISILFLVWFAVSYGEIISKNLSPDPVYHSWNLLTILMDISASR